MDDRNATVAAYKRIRDEATSHGVYMKLACDCGRRFWLPVERAGEHVGCHGCGVVRRTPTTITEAE